jgi:ribosome-associated translation inhibitor RaiA
MQIQINSGNTIPMHAALSASIEADLHSTLERFESQLTRVEVHISDENGDKSGPRDKRCLLEVRPRNYRSLTVSNESADIQTAVSGAAGKMERLLETTFGRLYDKRRSDNATPQLLD